MTAILPNPGPQYNFLASSADIAVYGGGAGGGKSWAILSEPLRHVNNGLFGALIFRKTYAQVEQQGGLWDEAAQMYPSLGAVPVRNRMAWVFPSGASIRFGHLEHEDSKLNYQGGQIAYLGFDELTHFSESQFFYLISRNRSKSGVRPYIRATCNPEPGWVAELLKWWIDQKTGYPIAERAGKIRWLYRVNDKIEWYDSKEEAEAAQPELASKAPPKSVTFIPAKLEDNPVLMRVDPGYLANLMSLPRVERARLLGGNWKISGAEIISIDDFQRYQFLSGKLNHLGTAYDLNRMNVVRFATVDTAGTSREKAEVKRGKEASWSVIGIWDYDNTLDLLFLRHVWRGREGYSGLRDALKKTLQKHNTRSVAMENAHFGPALADDLGRAFQIGLIPTKIKGMGETHRGAKLERAIASGLLSRIENGRFYLPDEADWLTDYENELEAWNGHPDSQADQIDISSHACWFAKRAGAKWGGVVN